MNPQRATGAVVVMRDDADSQFAVFEGKPRAGADTGPVYSAGPDGRVS